MANSLQKILGYAGPLEPKKDRKSFLDWLCSGISILIVVGSLVGIILWQVKGHEKHQQVHITEPAPSDSFNPATNK